MKEYFDTYNSIQTKKFEVRVNFYWNKNISVIASLLQEKKAYSYFIKNIKFSYLVRDKIDVFCSYGSAINHMREIVSLL